MQHHRLHTVSLLLALLFSLSLSPIVYAQEQNRGIDVVLIFDTSGPLLNQIDQLCPAVLKVLAALQQRGFDLQVTALGITSPYGCATTSVKSSIANSTVASSGDWGAATADVAAQFSWRTNTLRIIIPISNRGPALGDPVDDPGADRDSIGRAIKAAQASHVVVSPLLGAADRATQPNDRSKLLVLAKDLATGTGGSVIELSDLAVDPTHSIFELIDRAARTSPNGLLLSIPAAVRTLTCQRDSIKCVSVDLNLLVTNAGLALWFTIILGSATALINASLTKIHPPKMEGRLITGLTNGAKRVQHSARAIFAPETLTVGSASLRRSVSIVMLIVFVGLTALFAAFIDPEFNPGTGRGVGIFLSLFFAIGLMSLIYAQTQIRSARSMTLAAALRIRPLNLVIILMAALLSRVIGFLPGFMIGLPASYALISDAPVNDKQQSRIVSAGLIIVLVVALAAWLIAVPIDLIIGNLIAQIGDTSAASLGVSLAGALQSIVLTIYVVAIELACFALFPWTLTGGHWLYARSRWVWGFAFGLMSFIALETIFNPALSGFEVFQNSTLLIIGGVLAVVTGIGLSVWLSVNRKQASGEDKIESRSILNILIVVAMWLAVCACGAVAFITHSVNWGNVLIVAALLAIIAGGGFFALKIRAARVKDTSGQPHDIT